MRWIASAAAALAMAGVAYSLPAPGSAPVANDDFAFIGGAGELVTLSPLDNDSDPDGDPLTIVGLSGPGAEFAQIQGATIAFNGPDGFYPLTYTIEDAEGQQATASLQILVLTFVPICGLVECG